MPLGKTGVIFQSKGPFLAYCPSGWHFTQQGEEPELLQGAKSKRVDSWLAVIFPAKNVSFIYIPFFFFFSPTIETIHRKMIIRIRIVNWLDYCWHSVQEHSKVLKAKYYFHLVMKLRKDSAPNSLYINDLKIFGLGCIVFPPLSKWATKLFAARKCYLRIWVSFIKGKA